MRKVIGYIFMAIAWFIPAYYEVMILLDNPLQLFNPFLQFQVLWYCVTAPLFWITNILGIAFLAWGSKQQKVDRSI